MNPTWESLRLDSGEVHILPLRDGFHHESDDCPCGPTVEPVPRDDGSFAWMLIHHSLLGNPD